MQARRFLGRGTLEYRISEGGAARLHRIRKGGDDLDQFALSEGTSSATALATRAGRRIFDAMMDREGGSLLSDIDPQFYPVLVKPCSFTVPDGMEMTSC